MYVCWEITTRCNLSCEFCYNFKNLPDERFDRMLSIADALALNNVDVVNLTGGEPFLHPRLADIIDYCYKHFTLMISTNGMFLSKKILSRIVPKTELVGVSLDAVTEREARIMRGRAYDLSIVLANISLFLAYKMKLKINTIITKYNKKCLYDIANFIESLGDPNIIWKLYELTINNNVTVAGRRFGIPREEFVILVDELRSRYPSLRIISSDSDTMNSFYIIVTPNGDVHVPVKNNFKSLGNLLERPLADILREVDFDFDGNRNLMNYI